MSHQMNKALLLTSLAVLLALPASALAGTCGVLPFSSSADVNKGAAPNITALVSSELDIRGGYDLVMAANAEEFEGGDCGGSPACIKQFGQANKHEAIVAGHVATAGDAAYTLTLKLHDGRTAGLLRTVSRDVPSSADELMNAVTAVVVELVTGEAPKKEDASDASASSESPRFDDLDFDEMMDDADEDARSNNRTRGRAAPRNPGQDRARSRDRDDADDDDPIGIDELDALDLSAEQMEKKKRDRERQEEEDRARKIAEERVARERADEEKRQRVADERAREEEDRARAERAERDRRARAEREKRETEEREQMERERREREEGERQARADRERREREEAEKAERDGARRERERADREARAEREEREALEKEASDRTAREERDRGERERTEATASRQKDEYRRDRGSDEVMSDRVERERARRRSEEIDRAAEGQDDVEFASAVSLAPATGITFGGDDDDDDDDEIDDDDGGIVMASSASDIDFTDRGDDEDDDGGVPREGMIIGAAPDTENPGVRRRREAEEGGGSDRYARARDFSGSSRATDEDEDADYSRDDDDDAPARGRESTTSRSTDRDRDRSASRSDRGSARDERVASRDDSYLGGSEYDEYDLDADTYTAPRRSTARSTVNRGNTGTGNRPWFSARLSGGYTNYYLHFAQYGFDLAFFPIPRVSVDVQVDFWTLSIRECPECEQEFRTLPSFYLGGSYRFTNLKVVQPYVGGDVGTVVYAIGTLDDGSGVIERRPLMGVAFEAKGGVDIMFTRHFGIGAGLKAGLAYAPKIKDNVHPDWNPLQFLLNVRIAAVVQF